MGFPKVEKSIQSNIQFVWPSVVNIIKMFQDSQFSTVEKLK